MNSKIPFFLTVSFLITFALGCQKNDPDPLEDQTLSVIETINTGCKNTTKSTEEGQQSVELKAINGNQLRLTFVNAILNCCTKNIISNASIENNILKVFFVENPPGLCNCICPYDLECVIDNMESRKYEIEVYAGGDTPDAKFHFTFSQKLNMKYTIPE